MLNLKQQKQQRGYCGPASLKTVMDFYGIIKSQKKWAKLTKTTSHTSGCSEEDMIRAVKKLGFKNSYIKQNSSIAELKRLNKEGVPVIIDWFSPEEAGHFSVIAGFQGKNILIADPHFGKIIKKPIQWFQERWFDFGFKNYQTVREIIVIEKLK